MECFLDEMTREGFYPDHTNIERLAGEITYYPEVGGHEYSQTGCKQVVAKVNLLWSPPQEVFGCFTFFNAWRSNMWQKEEVGKVTKLEWQNSEPKLSRAVFKEVETERQRTLKTFGSAVRNLNPVKRFGNAQSHKQALKGQFTQILNNSVVSSLQIVFMWLDFKMCAFIKIQRR